MLLIQNSLLKFNPGDIIEEVLRPFTTDLENAFEKRSETNQTKEAGKPNDEVWDKLMDADHMSTRLFLRS